MMNASLQGSDTNESVLTKPHQCNSSTSKVSRDADLDLWVRFGACIAAGKPFTSPVIYDTNWARLHTCNSLLRPHLLQLYAKSHEGRQSKQLPLESKLFRPAWVVTLSPPVKALT